MKIKVLMISIFTGLSFFAEAKWSVSGVPVLVSQNGNSITIRCPWASRNCFTVFDDGSAKIWWLSSVQVVNNPVWDEATKTLTAELP
jgi:hypothetical protein